MAEVSSPDPSDPSSDYTLQHDFWKMVDDILGGAETMRATSYGGHVGGPPIQLQNVTSQAFAQGRGIEAQSPYLPKYPNEPWEEYDRRRRNAFFTNIYGDISNNLSSKPFSKTCELSEEAPDDLKTLSENIDGLGNNLHVMARDLFKVALDKGFTWIFVDFTKVPPESTLADERGIGARPYWVHIPVEKLLAVYSKFLNGTEIIFHARIDEPCTELEGYKEETYKRVRVLNREPIVDEATDTIVGFQPATFQVLQEKTEKDRSTGKETTSWEVIDAGDLTIGIIPLVPVILGKRNGTSWCVAPPLRDLSFMQVKLFQMESNLDAIKELTAFPMLAGNGIGGTETGADGNTVAIKVPVGPRGVLFAPPDGTGNHGVWQFIEPSSTSLNFLQADVEKHKTEMRDLGMQPLTASNLTVITTTNVSMKAHNAVQAWALMLKDALEQAWTITTKWLNQKVEPLVNVHTDFGVSLTADQDLPTLTAAEAAGTLSKVTVREEYKRRGLLSDDWTEEEEEQRLAEQQSNQVLTPEKHIDPITGMPVVVQPQPGTLNPPPKPIVQRNSMVN